MKNINLMLLGFLFLLSSCGNYIDYVFVDQACGCDDPAGNIGWLKELIEIAEADTTGNYWGTIYMEEYMGSDVFLVTFDMQSGGVFGYWYNCDGTSFVPEDSLCSMTLSKVIYSNVIRD
ncbi:MAG: hypothetical protein ACOYXB_14410 [Bacteroidota bacterium]